MDCIFCKIISKEIPGRIIAENEKYLLLLDLGPNTRGHSLVIPKEHSDDFTVLNDAEAADFVRQVHIWAPQIVSALGGSQYNLGLNNGPLAGQLVKHVHWHIIPRYEGDGLTMWRANESEKDRLDETLVLLKNKIK
ncbi:MAG: HIT family protein [Parcubacteria group bacterium]|nr:MAG: HIT family protein [Parcubacteria group bacterium]